MNCKLIDNDVEIFLYNIAWIRKNRGISKRKMSKILKINVRTLDKNENGILPPKLNANIILEIYCNFGVSPSMQFSKKLGL